MTTTRPRSDTTTHHLANTPTANHTTGPTPGTPEHQPAIELGAGALNWHADERRIDRYGTVHLDRAPDSATPDPVLFNNRTQGPSRTVGRGDPRDQVLVPPR